MAEQLELPLAEAELAGDLGSLERLGDANEFGWHLLELLGLDGWQVAVTAAFAGGSLVIASRNGLEVRRSGENVAAIAVDLFKEAQRLMGRRVELHA